MGEDIDYNPLSAAAAPAAGRWFDGPRTRKSKIVRSVHIDGDVSKSCLPLQVTNYVRLRSFGTKTMETHEDKPRRFHWQKNVAEGLNQ